MNNTQLLTRLQGIHVSMVTSASATTTRQFEIPSLLTDIKEGKWSDQVEQIRKEYARAVSAGRDPKKAVAPLKKKLPGVMWSGQFVNRKKPVADKLLTPSGFLCGDLDDLGVKLPEVRGKIITSPHLFFLFTSPTGTGLKAVFRVAPDAGAHKTSFYAVEKHVHEMTGVKIDGACKDISRLCFVSFDPELWINTDEPLEISDSGEATTNICLNTESCVPESLHLYTPASLHNKVDFVLANIKNRNDALKTLTTKHPKLVRLYKELIEQRFQARAHARNDFIVQAVPFLYHALAPQFILEFVACFYDCNRAHFNDSREQHMNEAKAMLESVAENYIKTLNAHEVKIYEALEVLEKQVFRICRDLSLLPEPGREPLTFFISFNHLADRLGIYPMQAQRLMRQFERDGFLKQLKKGTQRAAGVPGVAGTYQWLLLPKPERPSK